MNKNVTISREYLLQKPVDADVLGELCAQLGETLPKVSYSPSLELRSKTDYSFRYEAPDEWLADVRSSISDIARLELYAHGGRDNLSVSIDLRRGEASMRSSANETSNAERLLASVESLLQLTTLRGSTDGADTPAKRRKFFIEPAMDAQWYEKAFAEVQKIVGLTPYTDGKIRLAPKDGETYSFSSLEAFRTEVIQQHHSVTYLYLWVTGHRRRVHIICDVPRQLLELEIAGQSISETDTLTNQIVAACGLIAAPDDPYRYRRHARVYSMKWPGKRQFASTLRAVLDGVFKRPPVVVEAYGTAGGSDEHLQPATNLEDFLAYVGDDSVKYETLSLLVEGAHGAALGVHIDLTKNELEFQTPCGAEEVEKIHRILSQSMSLKLKRRIEGDGESDGENKKSGEGVVAKVLLAIMGAFLSVEFVKGAIPQYDVDVTFPKPDAAGRAGVPTGPFKLWWELDKTQWWHKVDLESKHVPPTTLRFLDSSGTVVMTMQGRPGDAIGVPDGVYDLQIVVPEVSATKQISLSVGGGAGAKGVAP